MTPMTDHPKTQREKFEQAARELETDDDPARFDERMKKLVRVKPTKSLPGTPVHDDGRLEAEADAIGAGALAGMPVEKPE